MIGPMRHRCPLTVEELHSLLEEEQERIVSPSDKMFRTYTLLDQTEASAPPPCLWLSI